MTSIWYFVDRIFSTFNLSQWLWICFFFDKRIYYYYFFPKIFGAKLRLTTTQLNKKQNTWGKESGGINRKIKGFKHFTIMYKNDVIKYYGLGWAFLRQVEKMYNGELIVFMECFFVYILESLKTCILTVIFVMCLPKKGTITHSMRKQYFLHTIKANFCLYATCRYFGRLIKAIVSF